MRYALSSQDLRWIKHGRRDNDNDNDTQWHALSDRELKVHIEARMHIAAVFNALL